MAQITVGNVIVGIGSGKRPISNVPVHNSSNRVMYVETQTELLESPGAGDTPHPTDDIVVSPKKFTVEANGERSVRILVKNPPKDVEKVYRVLFEPLDRGFDEEAERNSTNGRQTMLRIVTGMGILVFVEPSKLDVKFNWTRKDGKIIFQNSGNVHVKVTDLKACESEGVNCVDLGSKRVFPGNDYEVKAADNKFITFFKRVGVAGESERVTVGPVQ